MTLNSELISRYLMTALESLTSQNNYKNKIRINDGIFTCRSYAKIGFFLSDLAGGSYRSG